MLAALFRALRRFDWPLVVSALVLFCFGLAAIFSVELSRGGEEFTFIRKQFIALGLGIGAMCVVAMTNYHALRNYSRLFYIIGVLMLIAVLLFGRTLNGATGWFVIGGFAFQPVEYMKVALALRLAQYFSEQARRRFLWEDVFRSGALMAIPVGLLMLQPDLGGAALLVGMWGMTVVFAGIRWQQVLAMVLVGAATLALGWTFAFKDYQKERILTFLNPSLDPLDTGYNVTQAKIAIGAGGLWGRGLGAGSQSQLRFLPESQTDFVFAVIAEELGFVGVLVVILGFAALLLRMLHIARASRETFGAYICIATFAILFVEAVVHIGANISVMPATGVALPFVSYGGSSLLLSMVFLGLVQSVAVRLTPGDRNGLV